MIGRGNLVTEAGGIVFNDGGASNYARGLGHQVRQVRTSQPKYLLLLLNGFKSFAARVLGASMGAFADNHKFLTTICCR
jgi:hypothetical protein